MLPLPQMGMPRGCAVVWCGVCILTCIRVYVCGVCILTYMHTYMCTGAYVHVTLWVLLFKADHSPSF